MVGKSIKTKLVTYTSLIVIGVSIIFIIFLWYFVRDYYYSFAHSILSNEAVYSSEIYSSSYSDLDLSEVILQDYESFYHPSRGQVQILSLSGEVLLDTLGNEFTGTILQDQDIIDAATGNLGTLYTKKGPENETHLSISYPLYNRTSQVGMIRYTVNLADLDTAVNRILTLFIVLGLAVIALSVFVILLLSNSIITPINELTAVASRMSRGQYTIRAPEEGEDEIATLGRTMNTLSDSIVEKEQLKNEFISSISHELRTPLTSIKGWAITLKGEVEEKDSLLDQGLDIIENESDRLSRMVEELLDFSSFVSGKMRLRKESVNITNLMKAIVTQLTPRAQSFDISMKLHYDEEKIYAEIDKNRIKQVVINIIDNSIKFTPAGGLIEVNVSENENNVFLSIRDTGMGISEEEIRRVTQKFYKGSHNESHIGLGLSISEEIIQLHGGKFVIESILGKETVVSIELPKEVV